MDRLAPQMIWQPIETAPGMGKLVIAYEKAPTRSIFMAFRSDYSEDGVWRRIDTDDDSRCNPTHWMPLPEPPK